MASTPATRTLPTLLLLLLRRRQQHLPKNPVLTTSSPHHQTHPFTTTPPTRARNDTSTIDFAYLPMNILRQPPPPPPLRVPLLPTTTNPRRTGPGAIEAESGIMLSPPTTTVIAAAANTLSATATVAGAAVAAVAAEEGTEPTIHTLAGDGTHFGAPSAMSDADHRVDEVDFGALARGMGKVGPGAEAEAEAGEVMVTVRRVWDGVLEDIFGPRRGGSSSS